MARTAIVGAGVAGLAAARVLNAAGAEVVVFEKSRGLGGRMATRRTGDLQFDHGVQYVSAKGPLFAAELARWRADGAAAEWFEGAYVGSPRMTAPARLMGEALEMRTGALVTGLQRHESRWLVHTADRPSEAAFDAVILATPAPQAAPILATAGVRFPALDSVRFSPCWALMAAWDRAMYDGPQWLAPQDGALAWIAQDSAKPGRSGDPLTFVAHASPEWSRAHLEDAPESVTPPLLTALMRLTGVDADPAYVSAHRWRYALVEVAADAPYLLDAEQMIGACGDWCLGARVEAAFESGVAIGAAFASALELT